MTILFRCLVFCFVLLFLLLPYICRIKNVHRNIPIYLQLLLEGPKKIDFEIKGNPRDRENRFHLSGVPLIERQLYVYTIYFPNLVPRESYIFYVGLAIKYTKKVRCPGNEVVYYITIIFKMFTKYFEIRNTNVLMIYIRML